MFIKLAERTQALRELASEDEALRRKTADVRALRPWPTALGSGNQAGAGDLSCRYLSRKPTATSPSNLDERRLDRGVVHRACGQGAEEALAADGLSGYSISGRPKHISSILAKMRKKHLSFDEVYDDAPCGCW